MRYWAPSQYRYSWTPVFTSRAFGFLLVAILLFFLAGATNVGWTRIVDAVLWGMLGLSLLLQWLSVTATDARRRIVKVEHSGDAPGPMEDDVVEVELELKNRWFWPRFFLSVAYDAPLERPGSRTLRFFVANLRGHGAITLVSRVRCYRRGLHRFEPLTIESQVPFGLFRRRKRREAPLSLLVYPRAYPMKRLALVEGARGMSDRPQRARSGQEVIGSRQYHPGDPLRHIHWRNTARLRKLAVREMEDTAERALTVVFDARQNTGQGRDTTLEYSIKLAATIGLHAFMSGESVRLMAGNLQGEWASTEPFLRELALLEPSDSPSLAAVLQNVPRSSPAIAIVAAADHEGTRAVERSLDWLPGLAAVVLAGFEHSDERAGEGELLRRAGVPTVVCEPGKLGEAISALENLGHATNPATRQIR